MPDRPSPLLSLGRVSLLARGLAGSFLELGLMPNRTPEGAL